MSLFNRIQQIAISVLLATATPPPEDGDEREAIWSIPRPLRHLYFILFTLVYLPYLAEQLAGSATQWANGPWWLLPARAMAANAEELTQTGLSTAITALVAISVLGYAMIPYQAMVNKYVRPIIRRHEERGIAIGEERGEERGIAIGEERGEERGIAIGEERGEERGRKQGEQAQQQLWEEWLRRKTEREEQGLPFDEPPPSLNGNTPD